MKLKGGKTKQAVIIHQVLVKKKMSMKILNLKILKPKILKPKILKPKILKPTPLPGASLKRGVLDLLLHLSLLILPQEKERKGSMSLGVVL
jgi:hypothetical protein